MINAVDPLARLAGTALLCGCVGTGEAGAKDWTRYVNPFVGTGGHGHTFPGPSVPFGMVQVGPDTRLEGWDGASGYHYSDDFVFGFSHTHLSGTGVVDYGDVLLLPAVGPVQLRPRQEEEGYGSRFRHARERAEAGYYAVDLETYGTRAELTATRRAGFHRYTFPASEAAHVLLDLEHRDEVIESSLRIVSPTEVEGFRRSRSWAADQRLYFVARFSRAFAGAVAVNHVLEPGATSGTGTSVKAVLSYRTRSGDRLLVKVGISAVDAEGARRNLEAEIPHWDFDRVRKQARDTWNRALGRIEVTGGTEAERTTFYTALYHVLLTPNLFSDVDGRYRGADQEVHRLERGEHYTVFSLWDTFRAVHPLLVLLEPERTRDFVETFLRYDRQAGHLPVWDLAGNETWTMIGYHAAAVIADAYVKGVRGFDAEAALDAMKRAADADRYGLAHYRRLGYVPFELEPESVSKTLEYAYDDWTIARLAEALGRGEDARRFRLRSQAWRHLLDPSLGLMRPRGRGGWLEPFDPREVSFHYTEANAWQYSSFVPHDLAGLAQALGGREALAAKLDEMFGAESRTTGREQNDITGLIGQYAHGNEPSHHVAYLYVYAGQPWKTQRLVRRILKEMYGPGPDGLVGNEDCGQMSAWYVFSALGFYPVTPGATHYALGSPLFPRATVRLPNGSRLEIRARNASPESVYVKGARWNDRPYSRAFLEHSDLMGGGRLVFEMSPGPERSWGTASGAVPSTQVEGEAVLPAPYVVGGARSFTGSTEVTLASPVPGARIHYTTDGSEPGPRSPLYQAPIPLDRSAVIRFFAVKEGHSGPTAVQEALIVRHAKSWGLRIAHAYAGHYPAGGERALLDGLRGGPDFRSAAWQGYHGVDLDATIDFREERVLQQVGVGFVQDVGSWIFLPRAVEFFTSWDGESYVPLGRADNDVPEDAEGSIRKDFLVEAGGARARYLRVVGRTLGRCPAWHSGAGQPAWIFADEILVDGE